MKATKTLQYARSPGISYAIPVSGLNPLLFENRTDLMSIEEVATYLGVAPQTIRNWIAKRVMPYIKIGKRHMVLRASLEAWIKKKEVNPWP